MMTTHDERHYKTGGDPRTLADFIALRAEMNKLSHPARPDINWPYAEQLARSLLEHHGADLQTVAWYTLARARLGGLAGIHEGLSLMESLLAHQGKTCSAGAPGPDRDLPHPEQAAAAGDPHSESRPGGSRVAWSG